MTLTVRASRALVVRLSVLLLVVVSGVVATAASPATPVAQAAGGFTGLTPARLWDTRSGPGIATVDGASVGTGRLGPGHQYRLAVAGRGNVPSTGVAAVVINVTAIAPSEPSFLTVFPAGSTRPNASNLNTDTGRTLPNMAIVPLPSNGAIDVFNAAGTTDVAIDVLGWFAAGGGFTGLTPDRYWDTRTGQGIATVDGQFQGTGRLGAGATARVRIAGRGSVPATGAAAVALNVTAITPSAPSFITIHPAGTNRPNASNLNTDTGRTLPNMVIVPLPPSGEIDVFNAAGDTDVAIDVLGWFPSGADAMQPLTPGRVWETRSGPGLGTEDGRQQGTGRLGADTAYRVTVVGRAGVPPTGVSAVALNVTAIAPDANSFMTVYPGGSLRPTASNLNTAPGRTIPNMVVVPVAADGTIDVYNAAGTTDVAVDVLGWFPGAPGGGGGGGGGGGIPVYGGRLYYGGVTTIDHIDLDTLIEFDGPEVLDRDTEFAVNATATEFTYGVEGSTSQTVVIADLDTGDIKRSFPLGGTNYDVSLIAPNPDDTEYATIVFDPNDTFGPTQLVVRSRATGALVDFLDNARAFQWASDGSLVVIADPLLTGTAAMYVVPLSGPARIVATFTRDFDDLPTDIAISPDRSLIVYADQGALYAVPSDGSAAPRRIVESNAGLGEPTFSPDGRFLALSRDGDSGFILRCDGIYIVPVLLTGAPVYLIGGDADPFKIRAANGTRITSCGVGMRWV